LIASFVAAAGLRGARPFYSDVAGWAKALLRRATISHVVAMGGTLPPSLKLRRTRRFAQLRPYDLGALLPRRLGSARAWIGGAQQSI